MDDSSLDIGKLLKERREQLGYSLKEVSERIRIRKVYLENIEANKFSDLPGMVYVKGFVDVYSRYLGLDSKEIVSSLNISDPPETSAAGAVPLPQKFDKQFSSAPERKRLGTFGSVLLVVLVIVLAFVLVPDFYQHGSSEEAEQSMQNQVTGPAEDKVVEDKVVEDKVVEDKVVEDKVVEDKSFDTSTEKASKANEVDITAAEQKKSESLPSVLAKGSSLRMLALGEGLLIIKVDKREPFRYKLHDGLDLTWRIKSQVSVEMNSAGVVRFWLDGEELDISGSTKFLLKQAP